MTVADSYRRIEAWFQERGVSLGFEPGVDDAALDAAEKRLGFALPAEVRDAFTARNGQSIDHFEGPDGPRILFTCMRFHSLDDMLQDWEANKGAHSDEGYDYLSAKDTIRGALFHPKRLAFASQEGSTWLYIDLVPGPKGTEGQILFNTTEVDMALMGTSVGDFLARYADALDAGTIVLVDWDGRKAMADPKNPDSDGYQPFVLAE